MINTYITVLGGIQTHDPGSQAWSTMLYWWSSYSWGCMCKNAPSP